MLTGGFSTFRERNIFSRSKPLLKITVVEAVHIIPWNQSHDDLPTNGLALCRLCHWSFDEGLMSVKNNYEVLVSGRVQIEQNLPGHILTLRDRSIFTPEEENFRPAQENFAFHRKEYFRT